MATINSADKRLDCSINDAKIVKLCIDVVLNSKTKLERDQWLEIEALKKELDEFLARHP